MRTTPPLVRLTIMTQAGSMSERAVDGPPPSSGNVDGPIRHIRYWNGNYGYGAWGMGAGLMAGVGMWGMGSALYGYGYSGYNNPYYGARVGQAGLYAPSAGGPAYDYSQPINTQAAPPEQTTTDQATAVFDQAREAFRTNDYPTALARDEQALGQMPNDATLHEFLSLDLFAQGKYEPAAAPLYAVLSVGPGWH